ncbi:MetQ/NlpA family ABC transporter substrate-binding protein, partial [Bacillus cereus]|uniref:MetQ/NlpA family ABC transporter substrate-binding protein n=1 Tax=Bacillus cereus TaxID=1396 RepID=UPI000C02AB75
PSHMLAAGKDPNNALLFSQNAPGDHLYALRFVVARKNLDNPAIKEFVQIFQNDPEVRAAIEKSYGNPKLYALGWVDDAKEASR